VKGKRTIEKYGYQFRSEWENNLYDFAKWFKYLFDTNNFDNVINRESVILVAKYNYHIKDFNVLVQFKQNDSIYIRFYNISFDIYKHDNEYTAIINYNTFRSFWHGEQDLLNILTHSFRNIEIEVKGSNENYVINHRNYLYFDNKEYYNYRHKITTIIFNNKMNILQINNVKADEIMRKIKMVSKMRKTKMENLERKIRKNSIFKNMLFKAFGKPLSPIQLIPVFDPLEHRKNTLRLADYHGYITCYILWKFIEIDRIEYPLEYTYVLDYGYDQLGQLILKVMLINHRRFQSPRYYLIGFNPISHNWAIEIPPYAKYWHIDSCLNWVKGVSKGMLKAYKPKIFEF